MLAMLTLETLYLLVGLATVQIDDEPNDSLDILASHEVEVMTDIPAEEYSANSLRGNDLDNVSNPII